MPESRTLKWGILRSASRCALIAAALGVVPSVDWPVAGSVVTPAHAQRVAVREEFRTALQPYGSWRQHARWGEVWVPSDRRRDWRPYTDGRWAYTDDWGWYWASADTEDAWGWIVYHYGHWVLDADLGWVWVAGDEWSPGWVQWRRGAGYIGWAPLPPDDQVVVEYRDEPDAWIFVHGRDFVAPRLESVILPEREYSTYIRDTVVENRTVEFRDQHFAVNPGIAPAVIAASVGHSIRSFDVRPHVLAGTARINGAVEVRADELTRQRGNREAFRDSLRESPREFQPSREVPRPQALGANERGRLGDNPPRATPRGALANTPPAPGERNAPPPTQGRAPERTPPERTQQGRTPQERTQSPPATQGLATPNAREPQRQDRGQDRGLGTNQTNAPQQQRGLPPEQQGREAPRGGPAADRNRTEGLAPEGRRTPQQGPDQGNQRGVGRDNQRDLQRNLGTRDLGTRDNRLPEGRQQPEVSRPSPSTQGLAPRGEERQPGRPLEMNRPSTQGMAPPQQRQLAPQPERQPPRTEGLAGGGQHSPQPSQPQMRPQPQQPQVQPGGGGGPGGDRRGRRPGE